MDIRDLVLKTRSYRRFQEEVDVAPATLRQLVDLARLTASARNLQPLKYFLSHERQQNARIFPHLAWAGYLKDWPGPVPGQRPAAYIVILGDTEISQACDIDCGIAAQTILLGATAVGLGGCLIGSVQREMLQLELGIPAACQILLVVALGKPAEQVVIVPVGPGGDIAYWRDEDGVHRVPKRALSDIILE